MRSPARAPGDGPTLLELKTFRRMQHSMRANLPDVRDPATRRGVGGEGPAAAARGRARRSTARRSPRSSATSPREVEAAIEAALADEDASPDDLLPSVFGAHRRYPEPPAPGERALGFVAAIREALELELAADRRRDRDRRGHRPRRRPLPRDRGAVRAVRRRADPRHAADRERLRRLRRSAPRSPGCGRSSSCSSPTSPASRSTRS